MRQALVVVEQELKNVVPISGCGRLGPFVVDCPRSRSSWWWKRLSCSLELPVVAHHLSRGTTCVGRTPVESGVVVLCGVV